MRALVILFFLVASFAAQAYDPAHRNWNTLLTQHVRWSGNDTSTQVDYAGMERDRNALRAYLSDLSKVTAAEYARWSKDEQEAFLVNAYNAATVELVLTRYPDIASIKEIGGLLGSPWKQRFVVLLGKTRTLDEIEHQMIRGSKTYADPRIHFAVNCASIGCPALRPEAYVGARFRQQLEDQTVRFLRDRSRNRFDSAKRRIAVSSIFDWYGADFAKRYGSVGAFLARYPRPLGLDAEAVRDLASGAIKPTFGSYDWRLNGAER